MSKLDTVFNFFFPGYDINANYLGENISPHTRKNLKIHEEVCYICKKPSTNFTTHNFCKTKFNSNLEQVITCFYYNQAIKNIILNFKYLHFYKNAEELTKIVKYFFEMYLPKEHTALTFVPMHWIRKWFIKGYNQGEILTYFLSKELNLPILKLCKKNFYTKPQAKTKTKYERQHNLQNSFKPVKITNLGIKNIVIVDDILTTGATLESVANCIKSKYPYLKIYGFVIARK